MKDEDFLDHDPREPREERDALQLALHRDRIVLRLRDVFRSRPGEVRAAGRRLDARIRADIQAMHEEKRGHVRQQLALLPVAKRLVLEPAVMNADSGVVIDEKKLPQNFDALGVPIKPMPTWVHETYLAAGRMDHDILDMVQNLAGHLRNAQAGQIGDYKLPRGIDLRRTSAIDAFVFAISKLWSKGEYTAAEVRRSLDPKRVKNTAATPESVLLKITQDVAHARISRLVPLQEWWDIGLACVLLLDPDFDSKRACRTRIAPWRGSEGAYDREALLQIWYETDNRLRLDGLWDWAERCELYLTHAAKTGQRPRRVASDQEPPVHSGGSTQMPMSQDKGSLTLKADPSKPVDPEDLNRVTVDKVSQRILWRDQICHFVGKTQWQLVTLLNTNLGTPLNDETIRQRLWPGLKRGRTSVASLVNDVRNRLKNRGIPRSVISANRGWYHLNLVAE